MRQLPKVESDLHRRLHLPRVVHPAVGLDLERSARRRLRDRIGVVDENVGRPHLSNLLGLQDHGVETTAVSCPRELQPRIRPPHPQVAPERDGARFLVDLVDPLQAQLYLDNGWPAACTFRPVRFVIYRGCQVRRGVVHGRPRRAARRGGRQRTFLCGNAVEAESGECEGCGANDSNTRECGGATHCALAHRRPQPTTTATCYRE
mmetsp:Transcript_53296/g.155117  ORF Transcript_53296/g.155117 Transcript_53296/m.155117 type:complete len:205 (-) Transcript_53296:14-628(-)